MEKILGEEKKNKADLQTEKLREAELQLKNLHVGHYPESSLKEKIEDVFHDAKDFTKDVLFSDHHNRLAGNEGTARKPKPKRFDPENLFQNL